MQCEGSRPLLDVDAFPNEQALVAGYAGALEHAVGDLLAGVGQHGVMDGYCHARTDAHGVIRGIRPAHPRPGDGEQDDVYRASFRGLSLIHISETTRTY